MSADRLARAYRRRLWAYPPDYRRDRAAEIVATHVDTAPPGRTRPTLRETANLARHGLRTRLGRPTSRSVVAWALVAALGAGLYAAVVGAWLGWQTAHPVNPQRAAAVIAEAVGGPVTAAAAPPAVFTIYDQPLGRDNLSTLLSLDGGEYQIATTDVGFTGPITADRLRARLLDLGWTVPPAGTSSSGTTLRASRGDLRLDVTLAGADSYAGLSPATPRLAPILAVVAGLLGFAGGYAAFGWASRRTEGRRVVAALAKTGYTLAVLLLWAPILLGVPLMAAHHNENAKDTPLWEWFGLPALSVVVLAGLAAALASLTVTTVPRRRAAHTEPAGRWPTGDTRHERSGG